MNNNIKRNKESGFTLVELLAVIVILAIILVIAVPKIMDVINDAKKATLESTAKMIASQAEKQKVQNTVLGKEKAITCKDITNINDVDYASCEIAFDDNTAKVTIKGSGKFEGLNICDGTKTEAKAINGDCGIACAIDEQKETHNYVLDVPYEVNDVDLCVSYMKNFLTEQGAPENVVTGFANLCNGGMFEGLDFNGAISLYIGYKVFTEEELVENDVIKPKEIEEVELCMPKKPVKLSTYITKILNNENVLNNGLVQTNAEYNGTTYDAGIRYVGSMDEVKNKVYYNCEDKDTNGVSYGEDNYDYASSCEVWRIIGVFDTKSSTNGSTEKRVKIINTASTFRATWDSSTSNVNYGYGVNQWGESAYEDGSEYKGADLMQLLNGYYIGKEGTTCTYCNGGDQETCSQTCTADSLKSTNMKVLTNTAKRMIDSAVWNTYGVIWPEDGIKDVSWAPTAYLQERGISNQYTGKSLCIANVVGHTCINDNDKVNRTTSWTGLVGLMSVSDITYADGWLYNQSGSDLYPWSISPRAHSAFAFQVWCSLSPDTSESGAYVSRGVWPAVYLSSNIQIIGGDGKTEPYILKLNSGH